MEDVSSPLSLTACAACPCCAFVLWQFHHFWQKRWIKAPRDVRIMYFAKARSASEAQRVLAVWSWSTFSWKSHAKQQVVRWRFQQTGLPASVNCSENVLGLETPVHLSPRHRSTESGPSSTESGWKDHSQGRAANSTHKLTALIKERIQKMWSLSERNSGKRD